MLLSSSCVREPLFHVSFLSPLLPSCFPSRVQRHHQVLREGETVETLPARPVPVSLLWNMRQSMKTGHRAELDPGHTKDSHSHPGHDLCILPFIYLFAPPPTPMSTCTYAPEELGMFSYSVSWRRVLRIEKEMSKGGYRAGQADSSSLPSWFLPSQGLRDTGRASHSP